MITRAYFAQKDFDDKSILVDLYSSLEIPSEPGVGPSGSEDDGEMYMGEFERGWSAKVDPEEMLMGASQGPPFGSSYTNSGSRP